MFTADTHNAEGRRKLVNHVIHESHLEGHKVTKEMRELYDKYIDGILTIDQIKQILIMGLAKKVA